RIRLPRPGHAEQGRLLTEQVGWSDGNTDVSDLLKRSVRGGVPNSAYRDEGTRSLTELRIAIVDHPREYVPAGLEHLQPFIGIVVADVPTKRQPVLRLGVGPGVRDEERTKHSTADTGVAQELVGRRVHHVAVVPVLIEPPTHPLGVFDPDSESFLG